jgi:hypothetical protein
MQDRDTGTPIDQPNVSQVSRQRIVKQPSFFHSLPTELSFRYRPIALADTIANLEAIRLCRLLILHILLLRMFQGPTFDRACRLLRCFG